MFYKLVVQDALKLSAGNDLNHSFKPGNNDTLISLLIHDIFGGEILKTHKKYGWHFYNRIEGERIDLAESELDYNSDSINFEDIPSTADETSDYIEQEEYSTFMMKFIRAFEEAVGLENYRPEFTS
jgi:hypothetical protein